MAEPVLYVKNGDCMLPEDEVKIRIQDIADGYGVRPSYEQAPSNIDMDGYEADLWGIGLVLPSDHQEASSGIQVHPTEESYSAQVDPEVEDVAGDMSELDEIVKALSGSREPWMEKHVPDEEKPWQREAEYTVTTPKLQ